MMSNQMEAAVIRVADRKSLHLAVSIGLAAIASAIVAAPTVASTRAAAKVVASSHSVSPGQPADVIVAAPRVSACRLALTAPNGTVFRSRRGRAGSAGDIEFSWTFRAHAPSGHWNAVIRCTHVRHTDRARITLVGAGSSHARSSRVRIHVHAVAKGDIPNISEPTSTGAKGGGAYPAYGSVILPASQWFGGHGVDVHSNGSSGNLDGTWQCVELFERFNQAQHWIPGLVGGGDAGAVNLFSDARLNTYFDKHPNGSGYVPVPGDAIIFSHGQFGHVAIVDSVGSGLVNIVEQNASATGRTSISISGTTLGHDGVEIPVGTLHPKGDASPPANGPAPGTAPAATGPVFGVQNTSETPPDGVFFRNDPHTADTSRVPGLGVYAGERVQLTCYAFGDAVGPYADALWYSVANVTRPTVGSAPNAGWLNAHYINDGASANQIDAGVSACPGYSTTSPSNPAPTPTNPSPAPTQPQPTPTPPSPPPTYGETAGGVAHTWTNYTNAGGTQGPSIGANQTVQIACKIPGFAVSDGNTWWYRIASSPWNGQYYVSADAFYNNGATSGSLLGTPFVDPAVASC
jgi:CHAP domain